MKRADYAFAAILLLLAGLIWLRDLVWLNTVGDTLPIIAGIPLFLWLRRPWVFVDGPFQLAPGRLLVAAILFPLGILLASTLVLSAAWTALLASWMVARLAPGAGINPNRLLVLPFASFPWMATDLENLGWRFRLTGAAGADKILGWCGLPASHQGTCVSLNGFSANVESACSGLNGFESILIAGVAVACIRQSLRLNRSSLFWWHLPFFLATAWVINLIRIVLTVLCGANAVNTGTGAVPGLLHFVIGWLTLCGAFVFWWLVISLEERLLARPRRTPRERTPPGVGSPRRFGAGSVDFPLGWLEIVIVLFASWKCADLFTAWFSSPFNRFGVWAFVVWTIPIFVSWRSQSDDCQVLSSTREKYLWSGLIFLVLAGIGSLNVMGHLGFALVLMGLLLRPLPIAWSFGVIAWLPAAGWIGSRIGLSPSVMAALRVLAAALATAAALRIHFSRRGKNNNRGLSHVAQIPIG